MTDRAHVACRVSATVLRPRGLSLAIAIGLLAATLFTHPNAVAAQDAIEGPWVMTIDSPEGVSEFPIVISREGGTLRAATPPSPEGQFTFAGTIDGVDVTFAMEVDYQGMALPINLSGTVEGTRMGGMADFGGLAQGSWSAVRSED